VESVEGFLPERAVLRDPVGGGGERTGIQSAMMDAPVAPLLDEPRFLEDL
jgi:hypothetical protein